jgi:hypothetical protein
MSFWGRATVEPVVEAPAAPSPNASGPMARFIDGAFAYMGAGESMEDREARAGHVRDFARIFVGPLSAVEAVAADWPPDADNAPEPAAEPSPVRRPPGGPLPAISQRDRDRAAMLTRRAAELRAADGDLQPNGTH